MSFLHSYLAIDNSVGYNIDLFKKFKWAAFWENNYENNRKASEIRNRVIGRLLEIIGSARVIARALPEKAVLPFKSRIHSRNTPASYEERLGYLPFNVFVNKDMIAAMMSLELKGRRIISRNGLRSGKTASLFQCLLHACS